MQNTLPYEQQLMSLCVLVVGMWIVLYVTLFIISKRMAGKFVTATENFFFGVLRSIGKGIGNLISKYPVFIGGVIILLLLYLTLSN